MLRLRFVLVFLLMAATPGHALTVRVLSADDLLARADTVVHARCLAVGAGPPRGGVPTIEIRLAVAEALKGESDAELVVRQVGGRFAALVPAPRPGDEVLLFLHAPSRLGLTSPVGLGQGMLRVVRSADRGAQVVGEARIMSALGPSTAASRASGSGQALATAPLDAVLASLRARLESAR